jgi:succinoglycan biosynthesis transport protein ExoP
LLSQETIALLRERYRDLLVQRESLVVNFGQAHPKVVMIDAQLEAAKQALRAEVSALIGAAASQVSEIRNVEKGLQGALDDANRIGLELNLQDISHRRLQRERDNTSKLYGALLERTTQTDLARALQIAYARIIDRALVPESPVTPRVAIILIVGTLLGVLLGVAAALLLEQLDRVIRTVEDAEATGVTVLGVLPHIAEQVPAGVTQRRPKQQGDVPDKANPRDLIVHNYPKSAVAECCRTIRTNITFMSPDRPHKTLVVTSASPREGKTTVSVSMAISLAQSGKRVLIVDTDLRKPRIHRSFGKPINRGVTSVLVGEQSVQEAVQATEVPGLFLLASGPIPPNPSELLHSEQFGQLLAELGQQFDHLILDSPPLTAVTDAAIISPQVDGTIVVVHTERTTREALRSALKQLHDVHGTLLGGVLNDVNLAANRYSAGSYYYYYRDESYYQEEDGESGSGGGGRPAAQA